jgi:hypothetical protein
MKAQRYVFLHEKRCPTEHLFTLESFLQGLYGQGRDGNVRPVVASLPEYHAAVNQGIEGMVATHAYVFARMMLCASLTDQNISRFAGFAAKNLNA